MEQRGKSTRDAVDLIETTLKNGFPLVFARGAGREMSEMRRASAVASHSHRAALYTLMG